MQHNYPLEKLPVFASCTRVNIHFSLVNCLVFGLVTEADDIWPENILCLKDSLSIHCVFSCILSQGIMLFHARGLTGMLTSTVPCWNLELYFYFLDSYIFGTVDLLAGFLTNTLIGLLME